MEHAELQLRQRHDSSLAAELYFLIAKFLADGPCREVSETLKSELERAKILPQRLDWQGNEHAQSFDELEKKYSHIGGEHLLKICSRIGPVLEKEVPPCVSGAISLLGAGKQSLLRTKEDMLKFIRNISNFSGRSGGQPFINPAGYFSTFNIVQVLQGRENAGPLSRREAIPSSFYSKMQLYRHTLGHLSAVYCVLFDRTGRYIITGADDLLVKVWSSIDGRLLATFRGASSEIMDIAVNFDNTLLAAGSLDKIIRVWCFQTMSPIAVLSGHSGMITSVNFCPIPCNDVYYLVSTSSDGSVAFWSHAKDDNNRFVFQPKPTQYHEKMRPGQAQMICASFSPGGAFMAAGSADHHVRVYQMFGSEGPKRVLEVEAHSDTVDSIQWAHNGLKFISGSKDGTANVWIFEQQEWRNKILIMTTKLAGETEPEDDSNKKTKVTMVCWDVSDEWVVTAVNDNSLKVWHAKTVELVRVLRGHKDEVFVLESHPIDPRIILSAGHDGQLIIWDVLNTKPIACFQNFIEGQGNGAVFDAKWSPDGTMLAATDSHGHLMIYGFGSGVQRLKIVPKELFFHTDYRPLIRDANNYVLDEQTQTAPHLMPPPFLVDVDGNPYPPALQRLVPGRETCESEQLVPNIAVGASGQQEVIEGIPEPGEQPRSNIDRLIEQLAQRQHINHEGNVVPANNEEQPARQVASPRASRPGLRRVGDVEGVRQSSGNWQRDNTTPWKKPILARRLHPAVLDTMHKQTIAMAEMEIDCWRREMRRKPETSSVTTPDQAKSSARNKRNRTARHGYRTRATRGEEEQEDDEFDNQDNSGSSGSSNESSSNAEEMSSDSSESDTSSEYSDWMADHGENLEPPKRSKRKPVQKRPATPPSDSDRRRSQRPKKKVVVPEEEPLSASVTEVSEAFRPPEWLTEVIPKKTPYFPQMGDEVVYFRQGHQKYFDMVKAKKIYNFSRSCEPWRKLDLKAQEFARVVGIKYEIKPPRLCSVRLQQLDEAGHVTGKMFTVKYHDMPDVLDFIILRQTYELALERNWTEGNKFRCVIDDGWWTGQIVSVQPHSEEFPNSYFLCFSIRWDNGEMEHMSPWDLEPINEERLPTELGGAVPVLPEEIQETLYQPQPEEWPIGDRESTCRRIIRGLDQVMTLAIAEPFTAPVDLSSYPAYATIVEYPIDLSTIKARFENRFYRRIAAAQFDVRYLAANAEAFNQKNSMIVKQARIITDICLRIVNKDGTEYEDVTSLYHEIADNYHETSDSEVDVENDTSKPSTSSQRPRRNASSASKIKKTQNFSKDWRVGCKQVLETLWQCKDSMPFRVPVDSLEHPDYQQIIDTPMDLQTVREELMGGNYESPIEFAKDMKLIFSNSKSYNTNPKSKIYCMTVRLSAMFEEHMHSILKNWKYVSRQVNGKNNGKNKKLRPKKPLTNGTGSAKKRKIVSDEDDNDENEDNDLPVENHDEDNGEEIETTRPKRPVRNHDEAGPSTLVNGHSSRLAKSTRLSLRPRNKKKILQSDDEEVELESQNSNQNSSESSDEDGRPRRNNRSRNLRPVNGHGDGSDSDEYVPSAKGKQTKKNRAKNSSPVKKTKPNRTPEKRQVIREDTEEEEEEEEEEIDHEIEDDDDIDSNSDQKHTVVQTEEGRSMRPRRYLFNGDDNDSDESYEPTYRSKQTRRNRARSSKKTRPHRTPEKKYIIDDEDEDEEEVDVAENDDLVEEQTDESEEITTRRRIKTIPARNNIQDSEDEENEYREVEFEAPEENNQFGTIETVEGILNDGLVVIQNEKDDEEDDEDAENSDEENEDDIDEGNSSDHAAVARRVPNNTRYDNNVSPSRRTRYSCAPKVISSPNKHHDLRRPNAKRRYIEDSDQDDSYECEENSRDDSTSAQTKSTRRAAKRPFYGEAPSDEENSGLGSSNGKSPAKLGITISSRGRIRKPTPKMLSGFR